MKVTAIGVNAAFSTGTYEQAISLENASAVIAQLLQEQKNGAITTEQITARLKSASGVHYLPKWQSNLTC